MKGLLAILAPKGKKPMGAKGKPQEAPDMDDESEEEESSESGSEDAFAKEAFAALQDGDEAGFVSAFKGAVKACLRNYG